MHVPVCVFTYRVASRSIDNASHTTGMRAFPGVTDKKGKREGKKRLGYQDKLQMQFDEKAFSVRTLPNWDVIGNFGFNLVLRSTKD